LTAPLADAGISVFAISTFDTDYLLVKEQDLGPALEAIHRPSSSRSPSARSTDRCPPPALPSTAEVQK
jgi:hypothetical protein